MNAAQTTPAQLRQMLTIRRAEERVIHFAEDHDGLIRGHYHVYIGQEASGVGACGALGSEDYVFTTHRNHGHVVAKGADLGRVLAEIIGRTTGYNQGRGGAFHVIAPDLGILQTSGVVGGCLPLAAGAAHSIKTRGTDQVSMVFFGDGALEEGALYETINMASLWKLPVIFMCENNDVPSNLRKGGEIPLDSLAATRLTDISEAFHIASIVVDSADVAAVSSVMEDVVARTRRGEGPFFVEARITRWPGNMAAFPTLIGGDYQIGWAFAPASAPDELRDWLEHDDPISLSIRALVEDVAISRKAVKTMDEEVCEAVEAAANFALDSPDPTPESALQHVFASGIVT